MKKYRQFLISVYKKSGFEGRFLPSTWEAIVNHSRKNCFGGNDFRLYQPPFDKWHKLVVVIENLESG